MPLQIVPPGGTSGGSIPEFNLTDTITSREEAISKDQRILIEQGDFLYYEPIRLEWATDDVSSGVLRVVPGNASWGTAKTMSWSVPFRGYEKYIQFRCRVEDNQMHDAGHTSKMRVIITVDNTDGDGPSTDTFTEDDDTALQDDDFVHLGSFKIPDSWFANVPEEGGTQDLFITADIEAWESAAGNNPLDIYAPTLFVMRIPYSR